jgi:hypothetical protein
MADDQSLVPMARIVRGILVIRGRKVMLDRDLAALYGVKTKVLNQAVKRNLQRFPQDFMFQLTESEKQEVVTVCDHLSTLKFYKGLPFAFSEHGAVMLAAVLNSPRAIQASLYVVRAFVRLREFLQSHEEVQRKLLQVQRQVAHHGRHIQALFAAISELTDKESGGKKRIGF